MTGRCHICLNYGKIDYCAVCQHWFCADCRSKWTARAFNAAIALLVPRANCCGPMEET